jgi:hypothetical protein
MSIGDVRVIADKDYVDTSVVQYISKDDVLDDILENKLVVITDDESGVKQLLFKDKSKIRSGKTYAVLIEEVVAGNPVDTGEVDSEGNPIMEVPTLAGLGINGVSGGTNDSGSNSLIPTEDTAAPIISCNSTATAGTGVVVTISNYDNTKTYTFDKSGGSVSTVSSSGTFIWTMPIVSTNETHTIKVQASDNGSNPSTYSNVASVLVSNLLTLADDSMIFENATIVEDNFESIGGSLVGNTINAGTTIPALPESTNTSLVTVQEIVEGQRVQVYYDGGDVERVIGSVTVSGTTNTHDIFGDGSAVATYNLDGDATDLGGNYDGTASNVAYGDGKFGQCAVFDGSSYLSIPTDTINNKSHISISIWLKPNGDPIYDNLWFSSSVGQLRAQVKVGLGISFYVNGTRIDSVDNVLSDGVWSLITITYNGTTFKAYKDATEIASGTASGTINETLYFRLGYTTNSTELLNGSIDQVRIFNRALTSEEVTTLYNENVAKYTTPMTLPSAPTKIVTKDNVFESITFNHPLGYNWATNDVKLTLNKPRLDILSESTNLSLVTANRLTNGDKLSYLPTDGLEAIDFPIGSVTAESFKAFSIVIYTGNGSEQHIETGINSVDFTVANNGSGYWLDRSVNQVKNDAGTVVSSGTCGWGTNKGVSKVHIKGISDDAYHMVADGIRGDNVVHTDQTLTEQSSFCNLVFTSTGFSMNGSPSWSNASGSTYVAYQTLYTHIKWGTTNHGKFYIEAYNPATKEGMIYYVGSGTAGHEIPHSMGVGIDLLQSKNLSDNEEWGIFSPFVGGYGNYSTKALNTGNDIHKITFDQNHIIGTEDPYYSGEEYDEVILYYKCKSETFTIGTYTGTGTSGNFIETLDVNGVARKPRRVIIKRVDSADNWVVFDSERAPEGGNRIFLDRYDDEATNTDRALPFNVDGFTANGTDSEINASGGQYLYLVEFETDPVKYTTDISHLNLSEAPTTIFKDPLPKLETSVVADGADKSFTLRTPEEVTVDGNNVVIDYSAVAQIGKNGSFRITSDDDTISKLNIDLTREG